MALQPTEVLRAEQPPLDRPSTSTFVRHPCAPLRWGRAEAHAWLGIAYSRQNKMDAALRELRKALEIEPRYEWVQKAILPAVEKKAQRLRAAG